MELEIGDRAQTTLDLLKVASALYPGEAISSCESGQVNAVVRAGSMALKSPHSPGVNTPGAVVQFEANVVSYLPEDGLSLSTGITIATPRLIYSCQKGSRPYNTFSWVEGETVTETDVQQTFTPIEREQLGKDLTSLVVGLDNAINATNYQAIQRHTPFRPKTKIDSLREQRRPYIDTMRQNNCNNTAEAVLQLLEEHDSVFKENNARITCHGDLRLPNLTFAQRRLAGVFDFGELSRKTPAEELLLTGRLGRDVASAAIEQYELETGVAVTIREIEHYARAAVLNAVSFYAIKVTFQGKGIPQRDIRAAKHFWPQEDWSELDRLRAIRPD